MGINSGPLHPLGNTLSSSVAAIQSIDSPQPALLGISLTVTNPSVTPPTCFFVDSMHIHSLGPPAYRQRRLTRSNVNLANIWSWQRCWSVHDRWSSTKTLLCGSQRPTSIFSKHRRLPSSSNHATFSFPSKSPSRWTSFARDIASLALGRI